MRILIVEGDQALAASVLPALAEQGHLVDVVAADGVGTIHAGTHHYDLVILDAKVPSIDGRTACVALRADGGATPILMLSGRADAHERVAGLDAGADDFLPRPFDVDEFLARIRALGRRHRGERRSSGPSQSPSSPLGDAT